MKRKSCEIRPQSTGGPPRIRREKALPLYELAHVCCSTGSCRHVPYWPVEYRQDGWLQQDGVADAGAEMGEASGATAVELIAFSGQGVSVVMSAAQPIRQGARGTLITQAHGAGCSYHRVSCCWHRPHPLDHHRQCVGLRFDSGATP